MLISLLTTVLTVHFTAADYPCLCNYHVEREVYAKPDTNTKPVAYLYEFDCKPIAHSPIPNLDSKWVPIANEYRINYVLIDSQITKQVCPGIPASIDTVTDKPTTPQTETSTVSTSTLGKSPSAPHSTMSSTKSSSSQPSTSSTTSSITSALPSTTLTTASTTTTKASTTTTKASTTTTKASTTTIKSSTTTTKASTTTTKASTTTTKASTTSSTPSTTRTTTTPTTASTMSSTPSPTTTTASTTPTTPSTPPGTSSTTLSTSSTTVSTTRPSSTKTSTTTKPTQIILHSLTTTTNKPSTTDWTLVPWPTYTQKLTIHHHWLTHFHKSTTPQSSFHGHTTVNVGNLHLCPNGIRQLQEPGTRNLRQHGNYCYELRKEMGDWMEASSDCFSYANGFLVQIMSQQDQDFIMNFLREEHVHQPIWIGLNDKGAHQEEHFLWDSGANVKYTNWDPNRMDNEGPHRQEDCVILKPNGLWDDSICKGYLFSDHHHSWMCQYHIRRHQGG